MSYPVHGGYKESGVTWLGTIPTHWVRKKFKYFSTIGKEFVSGPFGSSIGSQFYRDHGVPVIRGNNLSLNANKPRFIDDGYVFLSEDKADDLSNAEVLPGDLVFTARGTVGQIGLVPLSSTLSWSRAILSANQLRYRNNSVGVDTLYLWYLFSSWFVMTQILLSSDSVAQPNLNLGSLKDLHLLLPPLSEQTTIATFLDRETTKIDTLIDKQQQLIKLLQEKRQAVISHAVTKGLNPDAKMKDSGVEWLGDVPEHWRPVAIKRLYSFEKRQGFSGKEVLSVYRDYGVIKKSSRDDNHNKTPEDLSAYQLVKAGDLVINKMKAWQGSLGISEHVGVTSPDYVVYSSRHNEDHSFLHHLLRAAHMPDVYLSISNGIRPSQWRLETEKFEQLTVFLPPKEEEQKIADYIERSMDRISTLTSKSLTQIDLLKERRTALISAAVTGKIDVRNAA